MTARRVHLKPQPKIENPTREDWDRALCRQVGTTFFYPDDGDHYGAEIAKSVCRACPLEHPCLEQAMARGERYGVWGATSPKDRSNLRRRQARAA